MESESGEGGSEMKDSFRVSRHLHALASAVRSCYGLWLHVCSWCSESAKISGRKLNNHVYQCTTALANNNGWLFSAVFSALKNYLKPSAWFNDVLVPALQSEEFTKYGLQWEDH